MMQRPQVAPWAWIAGVGIGSALLAWAVWGHDRPTPMFHDEAAYLLQAQLFAAGACKAPAAPMPEFFEQFHVLVTPFVAAKYAPGQALTLLPGVLLGLPHVMPLLLAAVAGMLVFHLARTFVALGDAALIWVLWAVAPLNSAILPSYLSETTSLVCCLATWATIDQWWRTGSPRYLYAAALCLGWAAITRPLTALVFACPLAVVVLARAWARRSLRPLLVGILVGSAVVSLLPLWNRCTTGAWQTSPRSLYQAMYMPWDRMGFGVDSRPPLRTTQPDIELLARQQIPWHAALTPATLPAVTLQHFRDLVFRTFYLGGVILLPFAVIGTLLARRTWVGVATVGLLVAAYSLYAHRPDWLVYYAGAVPPLAALPVFGLAWLKKARPRYWRAAVLTGYGGVFATIALCASWLPAARASRLELQQPARAMRRAVTDLHLDSAIVFVRYAPGRDVTSSLVQNAPFWQSAPVWFAFDRGPENARLLRRFPGRQAYLYDQASGAIRLLPAVPGGAP